MRTGTMKLRTKLLSLSLALGAAVWMVDAAFDALFFYEGTFLSLAITGVPPHELYIRTTFVLVFLVFGLLTARLVDDLRVREQELSLFRRLIDNANDAVYVMDPDDGAILDANDRAAEMLNYDREELLEMSVADLQPRFEDESDFRTFVDSEEGREFTNREYEHIRADGTRIPVEISARTVAVEGERYRVAVVRDISSRKEMQRALRESEERYRSLFNSIRDAILVADTDRKIIDCNPAFTDLFGYELPEIRGKQTKYVYASEDEFQKLGAQLRKHRAEEDFLMTVRYETKSGTVFPGETNVFYLEDDAGEVQGFIGLIRDISDRVERERQLQVMDRVLRHNLRNAMNVVMGHARLLMDDPEADRMRSAEKILETGAGLIDITDKEREIVNLLTGPRRTVVTDIGETCREVAAAVRDRYPEAQIETDVAGDLPVEVVSKFQTGLEELVENGVEHSLRDQPQVAVRAREASGSVRITVSDNGPGIPEEERRVLAGDREIQPLYHGSGLGLWLVSHVVNQSGGTLSFEETGETGTTVVITLPLASDHRA
ncbi:MAG: PAS domain S-box protein [Halodesulfurarchaeum sp.]